MPTYKPKYETVCRVRAARRDTERRRLADAYRAMQLLQEQRSLLQLELRQLRESRNDVARAEVLDVSKLLDAQRYEQLLRTQEAEITRQAETVEAEAEKRRQAVLAAEADLRAIEKLEQRRRESHRVAEDRREAKELDEIAGMRYIAARTSRSNEPCD